LKKKDPRIIDAIIDETMIKARICLDEISKPRSVRIALVNSKSRNSVVETGIYYFELVEIRQLIFRKTKSWRVNPLGFHAVILYLNLTIAQSLATQEYLRRTVHLNAYFI